ncbi:MAG: hypothetical protein PHG82_03695 [Candidatus Gracilibacteria bacterium]|nr:hypothetical protein [Candidatus Gracilibacteria bacterium]
MKKVILLFIVFVGISFGGQDTYNYFVTNFNSSTTRAKPVLIQNITKYNNSCGPTSLLFINNWVAGGIPPAFINDVQSAKSGLNSLYSYIGQSYNTTTTLDQLKDIAKNKWSWNWVIRMPSTNTVSQNVENLINSLNNDKPALIVLKPTFSGNPVGNYSHIVVVYAYHKYPGSAINNRGNDDIYFFDPYYGEIHNFKVSQIGIAVELTNFAYLQVAP